MRRSISAVLGSLLVLSLAVGLVPSADAAPLVCGSIVTRSRLLTTDLNCTGDGLVIRASGITLNLGGHTITGDNGAGDFGVDNTRGKDNVVIKNGTVQNFDDGVRVGQDSTAGVPTGNVVRAVIAINNAFDGIDLDEGAAHKVINSTASNNGEAGMDIDANRSLVKNATANGNGDSGINVSGNRNVITESDAGANGDEGVHLVGNRNRFTGGSADDNAEDGVDIEGNLNVVKDVGAGFNTSDGVDIEGDDNKIVDSDMSHNDLNGVFVESGDGTKVNASVLDDNGNAVVDDHGLGFDGGSGTNSSGTGTTAADNDDPLQCVPDICLP